MEGNGITHHHFVREHGCVVLGECRLSFTFGADFQMPSGRGQVVDHLAAGILLDEEVGLVAGNGCCHCTISGDSGEMRASRDCGQIMPMPRVAFAADAALGAEHVCGHVAGHLKYLVWLTSGARAEFQCDNGCHVACSLCEGRVVQEQ